MSAEMRHTTFDLSCAIASCTHTRAIFSYADFSGERSRVDLLDTFGLYYPVQKPQFKSTKLNRNTQHCCTY